MMIYRVTLSRIDSLDEFPQERNYLVLVKDIPDALKVAENQVKKVQSAKVTHFSSVVEIGPLANDG